MTPKISIIIPVYNVEPYLRRCLDSVVRQTVGDLQVICVNDGSTDGSRVILEEYAARDDRVMVLNQENSGAGTARNTAFPHIRGKYTFFSDADDWLDSTLCEKNWQRAEQTGADVVCFSMAKTKHDTHTPKFQNDMPEIRFRPEERHDLLLYFNSTWLKFWRSDFLCGRQITFSTGRRPYNDVLQSWKGIVLAEKIAILNEELYYRTIRKGSYQQSIDRSHFSIVDVMGEIGTMLSESGKFPDYRDVFMKHRLLSIRRTYFMLPGKYRKEFSGLIRDSLTNEDRNYLFAGDQNRFPKKIRQFYAAMDQQGLKSKIALSAIEMKALLGKLFRGKVCSPIKHGFKNFFH